ncbi:oxygenase MpaB family protein [Gordonia sp. (in: high G+C Gram-positive bacteria)]|uniref:oxygenase MpaB family protein n=1 Tax=Gordonia sp. (in: high G+C Gram-positive bacteria) TaxID=84139 RepID=UPI0039E67259
MTTSARERHSSAPARMSRDERDELRSDALKMYPAGTFSGIANVIMQLANAPVGRGVVESTVESGSAFKHPIKRARTTITYLAVAAAGTPEDRRAYREAVNTVHRQVRSTAESPVKYHAMDPALQLWVAACLYKGWEDTARLYGRRGDVTEEAYRQGAVMGTTLQMPHEMWPATRAEFQEYWDETVADIEMDDEVRDYLTRLARVENLGPVVSTLFGWFSETMTIGFLPPEFRDLMQMRQSTAQRAFFEAYNAAGRVASRIVPQPVQVFPFRLLLLDVRLRRRLGLPLV